MLLSFGIVAMVLAAKLVNGQDPEIVDDILPEVQPISHTARLNCTVVNKQTNNLFWIHEDTKETISIDTTIILQINEVQNGLKKYEVVQRGPPDRPTFTLLIRFLRQQDAGTYTCQIRIQNENLPEKLVRKVATLTVQVSPKITPGFTTTLLETDENQNSSLTCAATGIPYPNITWARLDGKSLPTGYSLFRGNILPLNNTSVEHMGVYRCVADNNVRPPDEHLCEVRVFHAPTVRTVQNSVGQAQNMRFTARLDCIVNGYPSPTVRWERLVNKGREILTDNDFFVNIKQTTDNQNLMSGEQWYTLKIKNVRANDYTDYFCIAENSRGSSTLVITMFETADCQGPNCPSLASGAVTILQSSFCVFILAASFSSLSGLPKLLVTAS